MKDSIYTEQYYRRLWTLADKNEIKAREMGRDDLADVIAAYKADLEQKAQEVAA